MSTYCEYTDVETRVGDTVDQDTVDKMISLASDYLDLEIKKAGVDPASVDPIALKIVCIDLVSSWWQTRDIPAGATSISQSVGDVSQSVTYGSSGSAIARSPLWLTTSQRRLLGILSSQIRTIQMVPDIRIW